MAVKEVLKATFNNGEIGPFLSLESFLSNLEKQVQRTSEFLPKALKYLFFVSIVFITAENMSCIHIKQ